MTSAASRLLQTAFRGILGRRLARLSGDVRVTGVHAEVSTLSAAFSRSVRRRQMSEP